VVLKINIFLAFIAHANEGFVRDVGCPFIAHVCLEMHGFVQLGTVHRLRTILIFSSCVSAGQPHMIIGSCLVV
jgi:hypothetical protein